MFNQLLNLVTELVDKVGDYAEYRVKMLFTSAVQYVRQITLGIVLLLVSATAWSAGILCLLMSLFFWLGPIPEYTQPALWTAGASLLIAFLGTALGTTLVRPPRR